MATTLARPIEQRFWEKVRRQADGCWMWTGHVIGRYGHIALPRNGQKRQTYIAVHRLSWELAHKESIPPGLIVRHRCDVALCVNPEHLVLGTNLDNIADAMERGRLTFGRAPLPAAGIGQRVERFDFTSVQAIRHLGLPSPTVLYRRIRKHNLPAHRVGGNFFFNRQELDQWLHQRGAR